MMFELNELWHQGSWSIVGKASQKLFLIVMNDFV